MPLGKTHDTVTFFLTAPVWAATWQFTSNISIATIVTATFLIGGLMFGPDLDTHSKQYTRWGIFKPFWYPYQKFFKHRSRWSHGLIFGTFLRVVYFMGVLTLMSFLVTFMVTIYQSNDIPHLFEFTKQWQIIGEYARINLGEYVFYAIFAGLWFGAASHTITDMAGSFVKTGRLGEFL